MNHWARILSELKITLARTPFRDWPAVILLWLHLRRLTEALDTLFTAWREGTLAAPQPTPAATPASPTPAPLGAPAVTPARTPARREPSPRRIITRTPGAPAPAVITPRATPARTPRFAPVRQALPQARFAQHKTGLRKNS